MRWLMLAAYIGIGLGSSMGAYSVRPSQGWGMMSHVIFWPVALGVVIGKTATKPDDVGAE